jgi:MtrB/PioB family decaheme-associated outer membrane protein
VEGTNLGIESRSVQGEYGVQGNYKLFIEYQQIPHNKFDDGATPYFGAGSTNLTLPPGWDPGVAGNPTPSQMSQLLPSLKGFEVETERQNLGAGVLKHLSRNWKMGIDFHHDTKEGIDVIGGAFATTGGNPKAVLLPEPIDYETNRVNFFTEYVDKRSLVRFAYELSSFSNNESSLTFRNPYNDRTGWDADAGFPDGVGQFALPPDNMAHSFSLSGARTLGMTSRVSANLTYTLYEQDETFLPYTANPLLVVSTPLPRTSLDGEIATTILDLAYSTRPMQKLDLSARYRFENRDNDTPSDTFIYIAGDAEDQPAITTNNARINLPYGTGTTHKVKLDGGYRVISSTKLSLGYQFEQKQRDFSEVDKTREHTVSAKVRSRPLETTDGWLRYAHSERTGSTYEDNLLFLLSHDPAYLATLAPDEQFENDPRLRKYYIADRSRDEVRGVIHYMPHPRYSIAFDAAFSFDDYDETVIGLTEQRMASATIDFGVNPRDDVTANAFVTYENLRGKQNGCDWGGGAGDTCITSPSTTLESWFADTDDRILTFGVSADWQFNSQLAIGTDISFSRALPDIVSHWYSLGAHVKYKVKKNMEARVGYAYESLRTDDFALDGVQVDTLSDVITLGESSPNYNGHLFSIALSYKF